MPPAITRQQSPEVDRIAVESYGMSSLVLMENAGRGATDILCRLVEEDSPSRVGRFVICCGKGNNAGDGFVMARHLDLRGYKVQVLVWGEATELTGDAGVNFRIVQKSGIPIEAFDSGYELDRLAKHFNGATWIIDALLGTGARGEPRPPLDWVIDQMNAAKAKRFAVDLPSGLDCDTGGAARHTVRADATCTFVAMKRGFLIPGAERYTGRVFVADIGVPRRLLEDLCE